MHHRLSEGSNITIRVAKERGFEVVATAEAVRGRT